MAMQVNLTDAEIEIIRTVLPHGLSPNCTVADLIRAQHILDKLSDDEGDSL